MTGYANGKHHALYRAVLRLSQLMAILGGIVLTGLIVLICISVAGRTMNTILHMTVIENSVPVLAKSLLDWGLGPILGEYEVVETSMPFAIMAFMPLCVLTGGHASVDLFTLRMPARVNRAIDLIVAVLFAVCFVLITWRMYEGMAAKMRYNESTTLMQIPIWKAYAAALVAAAVTCVVSTYVVAVRLVESATGRVMLRNEGADY